MTTNEPIYPIEQDTSLALRKIPQNITIYTLETDFSDIVDINSKTGTYGQILHAKFKSDKKPVVLKKSLTYSKNELVELDTIREVLILKHLIQYPETRVVGFYGICFSANRDNLYLVLEDLDYDLGNISVDYRERPDKNYGIFTQRQYKLIFYKLLSALNAIHSLGIIHNDIKLNNIMIKDDDIRIVDFGLAEFIGFGSAVDMLYTYHCLDFIKAPDSPDQQEFGYLNTNRKSYASDVYSLAVTMLNLMARIHFKAYSKNNKIFLHAEPPLDLKDAVDIYPFIGELGYDLFLKIMNPDTHKRWCAKDALHHEYFSDLDVRESLNITGGKYELFLDYQLNERYIKYSREEYLKRQMELCYLEEIHQNYKSDIIDSTNFWTGTNVYGKLNLDINSDSVKLYYKMINNILYNMDLDMISGIDNIVNALVLINSKSLKLTNEYDLADVLMMFLVSNYHYDTIFMPPTRLNTDQVKILYNLLTRTKSRDEIVRYYNDIIFGTGIKQFNFYPIWIHIYYVYFKLQYENDNRVILKNIETILKDVGLKVLFIFSHPITLQGYTIWEIVLYCYIKTLESYLKKTPNELIRNPIINWLVIPERQYEKIDEYFIRMKGQLVRLLDNLDEKEKRDYELLSELFIERLKI